MYHVSTDPLLSQALLACTTLAVPCHGLVVDAECFQARTKAMSDGHVVTFQFSRAELLGALPTAGKSSPHICHGMKGMLDRHGVVSAAVEMAPMSGPDIRPGRPGEAAQCLAEQVSSILTSSDVIPRQQLCIEKGESPVGHPLQAMLLGCPGDPTHRNSFATLISAKH